jgi:hypothetical protein
MALAFLCKEDNLPTREDELNRKLWFCIHQANRILHKFDKGLLCPPSLDAKNCPDADDGERAAREDKRPDFSSGFYDHQEVDPNKSAKFFVVECKRLGSPSGNWILSKNYIRHGVNRFVEPEWGYGKSASSSAMVGYIQSMEPNDILAEVNEEGRQNRLPAIRLSGEWGEGTVSWLEQAMTRLRVSPASFHLHHIWVDLRQKKALN